MKKLYSTAIALTMAACMATSAFADAEVIGGSADTSPLDYYMDLVKDGVYDDDDGYPIATTLIGPFGYESDDRNLTLDEVQYGETAYFLLTSVVSDSGEVGLLSDSSSVNGLRVKTDWEEGDRYVENVSITRRRVNDIGTYDEDDDFTSNTGIVSGFGFRPGTYYCMIAIEVSDSTSTSDADIIGTLTLNKSRKPRADEIEFDVAINVDWEENYRRNASYDNVDQDIEIAAETYYSVDFDGDEEIEIAFADDSTFTVDISGQGKTLIYYDTEFNSAVAARYPLAELNFWNGNGARFNRTGEFFLSVGDDADYAQYLYQIDSDGNLSEIPGAQYDDSDEGFYFRTRTLGSYVYSDMELDLTSGGSSSSGGTGDVVVSPVEPAPVTPVPNPSTGARA